MTRTRLSVEEKEEFIRLRVEERLSIGEIAERTGRSVASVGDIVKPFRLTAEETRARKAKVAKKMRQSLMDSGHYVGGADWSADDDRKLAKLWPAQPWERIEKAFPDRSRYAITARAAELGLRRSRSAGSTRKGKRRPDKFFASLREIREARGITREEFVERAGFHKIHFARIELGDVRPSWLMLRAWLDTLGYDIVAVPKAAAERSRGTRQWLTDEESILRELLAQGSTIQEAGLALKRPAHEVEKHAQTLGILESERTRNVSGMTRLRLS